MADHSLPSDDHKVPLLPIHEPQQRPTGILTKKNLCIICGPLACLLIFFFVDLNGQHKSRNMLAVLTWVFLWWITEAVPMAITSMSPLFLFPLFGISSSDEVAKCYMDDIIALVLGSFILALAVEHYNIHRRLALKITSLFCGDPVNPPLLLLGICGTTAFVSMWMHNTPCALMMMPVATGILHKLPHDSDSPHKDVTNFCKAVVLGVIYATAIGGISTLTGTGVNLILVGMWETYYPQGNPIGFSTWSFFAVPLALIIFVIMWAILCFMYCSKTSRKTLSAYLDRNNLKAELDLLGPVSFAEKMVLLLFGLLVFLWMTRTITDTIPGWGALFHDQVGDGTASVLMATFLFVIPSKRKEGEMLMDWNKCKKLPWGIILLLGAGFAIADGVRRSGLTDVISSNLDFLTTAPYFAVAPLVCLVSGTITEFTSNNATTTLVIPILVEVAKGMSIHPLLLLVPGAIGAQFAFLLPTSTPPNIVGFSTGHFQMQDMIKTGAVLKIAGIIVVSVLMPTLGALVFNTNSPL